MAEPAEAKVNGLLPCPGLDGTGQGFMNKLNPYENNLWSQSLFDSDAFGEIAGLVDGTSAQKGHVVRQELERDDRQ